MAPPAEPQFGWWVQVASERLTASDLANAQTLGETWRVARSQLAASLADPFADAEINLSVDGGADGDEYEIKLCVGWTPDEGDPWLQELLSWIHGETAYSDAYLVRLKMD